MNKRFSTLLAVALMAGGFSANATISSIATPKHAAKVEAGKYYHVGANVTFDGTTAGSAAANGLVLSATKHEGKDSIRVKSLSATGALNAVMTEADLDSTLWLVTESTQGVTGKKIYSFVNKATGAKLQFAKKGNAVVADGLNEWAWEIPAATTSATAATVSLTNTTGGKSYSINVAATVLGTEQVTVVEAAQGASGFSLMVPGDIKLTAAQLNDANSTYFKLAFGNDIADNIFTKYKMEAIPAGESDGIKHKAGSALGTDSVYIRLTGAPGVTSKWNDKLKNDTLFMVVDTTFHEIGSATWASQGGFKLTMDTLTNVTNQTSVYAQDTIAAGERNLATYKFLFFVNKGRVSGDSIIVKLNTPAITHKVPSIQPSNTKEVTGAYLSWGFIGNSGSKVLTTSNDNTKLPLISFLQGTKVTDLNESVAYFIKVVKGANKDNNGKDFVVPYLTGSAGYYKDAASALVPSTQWSIKKNAAGNYTFTNREDKSKTFTTPVYKEGDNYAIVSTGGKDTVSFTTVATEGKFVGYKHFTNEEIGNLSVSLQFVTPLGTSAYVYVADKDSMLRAKDMEEGDATKFKLVAANKGVAFGADSLEATAYILKEQFGDARVLGYNTTSTLFRLMKTNQTTADSTAVIFRATKNEGEYQVFAVTKTGGTTTPYVFTSTAEKQATIAGSNADMVAVGVTATTLGYFKVTTPEAPEYINITGNSSKHIRFSSAENSTLMLGMNEEFKPVLKAEAEMDAAYSLFVDTADVTDQATPKFYLMTTAGLGELKAETVDAIQANYLNVDKDGNLEFIVAKQFGATNDTLLVYNREDLTAAPDTVKKADNKAMFKFRATPVEGEMLIEAATGKCMQQINGKLALVDADKALAFTSETVDAPVGNESIDAATIKVVAGEGNVTVYGAAGKKVSVSDVLGRTTTVVATSDSQTVAVAAGVAIIAVEGEAAVKAVVK